MLAIAALIPRGISACIGLLVVLSVGAHAQDDAVDEAAITAWSESLRNKIHDATRETFPKMVWAEWDKNPSTFLEMRNNPPAETLVFFGQVSYPIDDPPAAAVTKSLRFPLVLAKPGGPTAMTVWVDKKEQLSEIVRKLLANGETSLVVMRLKYFNIAGDPFWGADKLNFPLDHYADHVTK